MLDPAITEAAQAASAITRLAPASRAVLQCRAAARPAVAAAIGLALPVEACQANARDKLAALWLGPEEWLLLAPESDMWMGALLRNLDGASCSAVDVSDRQVAFAVHGPSSETILGSGCPLDLHPSSFPVGMCTRTLFHKAQIVLWRTDADRFHLEVWRSFSTYVEALLTLAATQA